MKRIDYVKFKCRITGFRKHFFNKKYSSKNIINDCEKQKNNNFINNKE